MSPRPLSAVSAVGFVEVNEAECETDPCLATFNEKRGVGAAAVERAKIALWAALAVVGMLACLGVETRPGWQTGADAKAWRGSGLAAGWRPSSSQDSIRDPAKRRSRQTW